MPDSTGHKKMDAGVLDRWSLDYAMPNNNNIFNFSLLWVMVVFLAEEQVHNMLYNMPYNMLYNMPYSMPC